MSTLDDRNHLLTPMPADLDWEAIAAAVPCGLDTLPHVMRHAVEEAVERYRWRVSVQDRQPTRAAVAAAGDEISRSANKLASLIVKHRLGHEWGLFRDADNPPHRYIPTEELVKIIESIPLNEYDLDRFLREHGDEVDRVPAAKRLGLQILLACEAHLGLPLTVSTPADRQSREPFGPTFPVVRAIFDAIAAPVSATTVEQWCRDARPLAAQSKMDEQQRALKAEAWSDAIDALVDEKIRRNSRDRDWLRLEEPSDEYLIRSS